MTADVRERPTSLSRLLELHVVTNGSLPSRRAVATRVRFRNSTAGPPARSRIFAGIFASLRAVSQKDIEPISLAMGSRLFD